MQDNRDVCRHCDEAVGEDQACSDEQAPKCTNLAGCGKPTMAFLGSLDDGEEFRRMVHRRYG